MEVSITRNRQELDRLEGIIKKNLSSFYEVGCALAEIRDQKLYLDAIDFDGHKYETFEKYCKERWEMDRRNAYYLIDSASVVENVKHVSKL